MELSATVVAQDKGAILTAMSCLVMCFQPGGRKWVAQNKVRNRVSMRRLRVGQVRLIMAQIRLCYPCQAQCGDHEIVLELCRATDH